MEDLKDYKIKEKKIKDKIFLRLFLLIIMPRKIGSDGSTTSILDNENKVDAGTIFS